jgi:Fe-S cluster assembly protein SufB
MVENQSPNSEEAILDAIVTTPYKYGFKTNLETEEFEKGLNGEIVKKISLKKDEPEFLRKFRNTAFLNWKKSKTLCGPHLIYPILIMKVFNTTLYLKRKKS